MPDFNGGPLARNRGLITDDEQRLLRSARVLIAGVGGVGGRTAETLARLGIGHLRLTDPDHFCVSNLNRQAGATVHTLGQNKAAVIAELCADVGTGTDVEFFDTGVTTTNVAAMLTDVDLVVDAIDYTVPHLSLSLARAARDRSIPVLTAVEVGYSVWQTVLLPHGMTFERFYGLPLDVSVDDVAHGLARVPLWRLVLQRHLGE
ncbi:ThiF family adenylyltransferase [Nocardia sp. NPDC058658]|uniref:ThiF family adenylyltransferase n=1 Tax=Nocardia sp. NPDC058658 TaxID=3346580 RepID=UPI003655F375